MSIYIYRRLRLKLILARLKLIDALMAWQKLPTPEVQPSLALPVLQDIGESQDNRYEYSALPGPRHIRVLVVEPSPLADPVIRTCIETVLLDENPEYAALSYSWGMNVDGDATANRTILVHGSPLPVTQNLIEGLLRLRPGPSERPLRIWIDAVCINQQDDIERTEQVAMMANIYAYARRLIIWLGEGSSPEEDEIALYALKLPYEPRERNDVDLRWHSKALTDCLSPLYKRRYFTRRWVVQEVQHSDRYMALVYWGHCSCSLISMTAGFYSDHNRRLGLSGDGRKEHFARAVFTVWEPGGDVVHLIQKNHELECSDDRDRLYALVSLAKDLDIKADYTKPTEQVYTEFARHLAAIGRSDILVRAAAVRHARQASIDSSNTLHLPIWVPDLRCNPLLRSWPGHPTPARFEGEAESVLVYTPFYLGLVAHVNKKRGSFNIDINNPVAQRRARSSAHFQASLKPWRIRKRRLKLFGPPIQRSLGLLTAPPPTPLQEGDIICACMFLMPFMTSQILREVHVLRKVDPEEEGATPACRFVNVFGYGSNHQIILTGHRYDELRRIEIRLGMDYAYPTLPT